MIKKVAMELGMGTSLRHANYTAAAKRAVSDAYGVTRSQWRTLWGSQERI